MNQHTVKRMRTVVGGMMICVGIWALWELATGHAWNCPQLTLVSVRSGLGYIAGIFMGIHTLMTAKHPKLAVVFAIFSIPPALVSIALFLQVDSVSCSAQ